MSSKLAAALFLIHLAPSAFCQSIPQEPRRTFPPLTRIAVVVGVGAYSGAGGFQPLRYAPADALRVAEELRRQGYEVENLGDKSATKDNIEAAIRKAGTRLDKNEGTLLFFFSGHGVRGDKTDYLVLADEPQGKGPESIRVPLDWLRQLMSGTRAPHQMMFIDACRNSSPVQISPDGDSPFIPKGSQQTSSTDFSTARGIRILYATEPGGLSYEDKLLHQGVFTNYLLEGLAGGAARDDGKITFFSLADYVRNQIKEHVRANQAIQLPYDGGEAGGDLVVGMRLIGSPIPPLPIDTRGFVTAHAGQGHFNPNDGQHYNWIPGGTFEMGCDINFSSCREDEHPRHQVTITTGFWIGQTEVSVGAYMRFVNRGNAIPPPKPNTFSQSDQDPVVGISWKEADAFCRRWAGGRLPTEAEWEYATQLTRDGIPNPTPPWAAWYSDNSGNKLLDSDGILKQSPQRFGAAVRANGGRPHPVNGKQPTDFGLFDLLGNVWEWTGDWYEEYRTGLQVDPTGPPNGYQKVLRGGAWDSPPSDVRVTRRYPVKPDAVDDDIGFRCVAAPTQTDPDR